MTAGRESGASGVWLSLVEQGVWDVKVVGSNPSIPTNSSAMGSHVPRGRDCFASRLCRVQFPKGPPHYLRCIIPNASTPELRLPGFSFMGDRLA